MISPSSSRIPSPMVTTVWTRRRASRMRCREQNGFPAGTAAVISCGGAGPVVGVLVGAHQRGGGDDLAGGEPVDGVQAGGPPPGVGGHVVAEPADGFGGGSGQGGDGCLRWIGHDPVLSLSSWVWACSWWSWCAGRGDRRVGQPGLEVGRGARRRGSAGTVSGAGRFLVCADAFRVGRVLLGSALSRVLSARSAVLSLRSSWVSCSRSRILPIPVRLTPSATSSAIRRSRRRSSWLNRRVPPVVRAGRQQPVPLVQPERADRQPGQLGGHRDAVHAGGGIRLTHPDHTLPCR